MRVAKSTTAELQNAVAESRSYMSFRDGMNVNVKGGPNQPGTTTQSSIQSPALSMPEVSKKEKSAPSPSED